MRILFKKSGRALFLFVVCFLLACASTGEFDEGPKKRKRKRKKESAAQSLRAPAGSGKAALFFDNSGLDFLSKKLEDTISGYEGLQEKIAGLEDRLKNLIFLLERKIQAEKTPKSGTVSSHQTKSELTENEELEAAKDSENPGKDLAPVENEEVMEGEPEPSVPDLPAENVISSGG